MFGCARCSITSWPFLWRTKYPLQMHGKRARYRFGSYRFSDSLRPFCSLLVTELHSLCGVAWRVSLGRRGRRGQLVMGSRYASIVNCKQRAFQLTCRGRLSMTCLSTSQLHSFLLSLNSCHLYWRTCWRRPSVYELRHAMHLGDLCWAALVSHHHPFTIAYQILFLPS